MQVFISVLVVGLPATVMQTGVTDQTLFGLSAN